VVEPLRYTGLFTVLKVAAVVLFLGGIAVNVAFWLGGPLKRADAERRSSGAKLWALVVEVLSRTFSLRGVKVVALDVLLQRQSLRMGLGRWLTHLSLSLGFMELFFVGSMGLFLADLGLVSLTKDTAWFALLNDFFGLALPLGVVFAVWRRFIVKMPQLTSDFFDRLLMSLLALVIVTGFLVEGARLAKDLVPFSEARYSFVGVRAAGLWPSAQSAAVWYGALWWGHAVMSLAFVVCMPFTKLFHMMASPLSLLLNDREARSEPPPAIPVPLDVIHRHMRDKETAPAPSVKADG
jgi:nitrate reductase gamma subunit